MKRKQLTVLIETTGSRHIQYAPHGNCKIIAGTFLGEQEKSQIQYAMGMETVRATEVVCKRACRGQLSMTQLVTIFNIFASPWAFTPLEGTTDESRLRNQDEP